MVQQTGGQPATYKDKSGGSDWSNLKSLERMMRSSTGPSTLTSLSATVHQAKRPNGERGKSHSSSSSSNRKRAPYPSAMDTASKALRKTLRQKYIERELERIKSRIINAKTNGTRGTRIMRISEWKRDWCTTSEFNQTISAANCLSVKIQNRYCYGQCNSIFIPGSMPLSNCQKCQPRSYSHEAVTLDCSVGGVRTKKVVKVQKVHSCSCRMC